LSDNTALYFNDMRLFGYLKLVDTAGLENAKARFGQEPISDNFNLENFLAGLKKRRTPIKAVLLDQTFIAGLGNIYVDETLFLAGVKPTRSAHLVTRQEARKIAKFSGQIMQKAISVGGTTFQHFADTGGKAGNYSDHLKIFGKQNMPCLKCKKLIIKIRLAGRGTHFCPTCQK
jgi:formamidopyrimidine-DNA glycosylase